MFRLHNQAMAQPILLATWLLVLPAEQHGKVQEDAFSYDISRHW
jgi:hypothetical protein